MYLEKNSIFRHVIRLRRTRRTVRLEESFIRKIHESKASSRELQREYPDNSSSVNSKIKACTAARVFTPLRNASQYSDRRPWVRQPRIFIQQHRIRTVFTEKIFSLSSVIPSVLKIIRNQWRKSCTRAIILIRNSQTRLVVVTPVISEVVRQRQWSSRTKRIFHPRTRRLGRGQRFDFDCSTNEPLTMRLIIVGIDATRCNKILRIGWRSVRVN